MYGSMYMLQASRLLSLYRFTSMDGLFLINSLSLVTNCSCAYDDKHFIQFVVKVSMIKPMFYLYRAVHACLNDIILARLKL